LGLGKLKLNRQDRVFIPELSCCRLFSHGLVYSFMCWIWNAPFEILSIMEVSCIFSLGVNKSSKMELAAFSRRIVSINNQISDENLDGLYSYGLIVVFDPKGL
jgi:hypothetical protein